MTFFEGIIVYNQFLIERHLARNLFHLVSQYSWCIETTFVQLGVNSRFETWSLVRCLFLMRLLHVFALLECV